MSVDVDRPVVEGILGHLGDRDREPPQSWPCDPPMVTSACHEGLHPEFGRDGRRIVPEHDDVLVDEAMPSPADEREDLLHEVDGLEKETASVAAMAGAVRPHAGEVLARWGRCPKDRHVLVGVGPVDLSHDRLGRVLGDVAALPDPGETVLDYVQASEASP